VIWLTWRQFRSQAFTVAGALAVVAIVLAVTGPHLVQMYDSYLASCKVAHTCASSPDPVLTAMPTLRLGMAGIVLLAPALIGIFWGAPLIARELETGTYRLGWTQSVTRERWLAAKLGVVGLASVAVAGLLSLMVTWWSSPFEAANGDQFQAAIFGLRDITPIGYAAFAFVLGTTAGVVMRRTLPAMASTIVAFVFVRLAVTYWVRPHLLPPTHTNMALTGNGVGLGISPSGIFVGPPSQDIPNAWVYSTSIVNKAGQAPTQQWLKNACPGLASKVPPPPLGGGVGVVHGSPPGNSAFSECADKVAARFHEVVVYQPPSHYWPLQGLETALFLLLAALLAGFCFWWVRHRLS
jgi:hypothetical protein